MRLQRWTAFCDEVDSRSAAVQGLPPGEVRTLIEQCVLSMMQAIRPGVLNDPNNVAATSLENLVSVLLTRSLACGKDLSRPMATLGTLLGARTVPEKQLAEALAAFDEGPLFMSKDCKVVRSHACASFSVGLRFTFWWVLCDPVHAAWLACAWLSCNRFHHSCWV